MPHCHKINEYRSSRISHLHRLTLRNCDTEQIRAAAKAVRFCRARVTGAVRRTPAAPSVSPPEPGVLVNIGCGKLSDTQTLDRSNAAPTQVRLMQLRPAQ
jgi:hypothetical protein